MEKLKIKSKQKRKIVFEDNQKFPDWREDKKLVLFFFLGVGLLIVAWGVIGYFYKKLPPTIPLFYSKIGSDVLTEKINLFSLPLGFAFFSSLNYYLAHIFYYKDKLLSEIYIYMPLFLNLLMILVVFRLFYVLGIIF